jgi:hypothetical protein
VGPACFGSLIDEMGVATGGGKKNEKERMRQSFDFTEKHSLKNEKTRKKKNVRKMAT